MGAEIGRVEKRCKCPCGNGEIVYGDGMDDWNRMYYGLTEIWCPNCVEKYQFELGTNGLIEKSYPPYKGDEKLYERMNSLRNKIHNYDYLLSAEIKRQRLAECCIPSELEIINDETKTKECKTTKKYILNVIISYARDLSRRYTLEELQAAKSEMQTMKYSTKLTGKTLEIAQRHKFFFKTIKLNEVLYPVEVAIRNYNNYKRYDTEDEKEKSKMQNMYDEIEKMYYVGYEEYKKERAKHIIYYELK